MPNKKRDNSDPFRDDPFFQSHSDSFDQRMGFGERTKRNNQRQRSLTGPEQSSNLSAENSIESLMPNLSGIMDSFGSMDHMMQNMDNRQKDGGQYFSQSSVMTYNNTGNGPPEIFQASSSTKRKGEYREDRKMLRDTKTQVDKREIDRSIGQRGHRMNQKTDLRNRHVERSQDYRGFNEDQIEDFNRDWQGNDLIQGQVEYDAHRRHHQERSGHSAIKDRKKTQKKREQ